MILKQDMTTSRLLRIINELQLHENPDKAKVLQDCIQERLNKSLKEYYNELSKTLINLSLYAENHDIKLMKKINKELKDE